MLAFPYMWAYDGLEPAELKARPYGEPVERRAAGHAYGSLQLDNGPRTVQRLGGRFTTPRRLGGSFEAATFERHTYYSGHLTANTSEDAAQVADWGLGFAALTGHGNDRYGGSIELSWEGFNHEPLSAHARYQAGILTDKRVYHDLSIHLGAVWHSLGLSAGWRAWLTPLRNSTGPELLLRLWL